MKVVIGRPKVVGVLLLFCTLGAVFMALIGALGSGDNWIGWALAILMLLFGSMLTCLSAVIVRRGKFRSARPRARWHSAEELAEIMVDTQSGKLLIGDTSGPQELLRIPWAFTTDDSRQHLLNQALKELRSSGLTENQ